MLLLFSFNKCSFSFCESSESFEFSLVKEVSDAFVTIFRDDEPCLKFVVGRFSFLVISSLALFVYSFGVFELL